jgi:hypothetical protein
MLAVIMVAGLAGIFGLLTPGTGFAATSAQAHLVTQAAAVVPAAAACTGNRNYLAGYATFTYCNGTKSREYCFVANNGAIFGPLYAANGCDTQLYLYLGHTTTGAPALCVNPRSSTGVLKRYYEEFVVTGHTGNC